MLEQTAQYLGAACHESQNTKGSVFLKFHLPMKKTKKTTTTTTTKKKNKESWRKASLHVVTRDRVVDCRRKFPKTNRRRECVHLREAFYARRHRNSEVSVLFLFILILE